MKLKRDTLVDYYHRFTGFREHFRKQNLISTPPHIYVGMKADWLCSLLTLGASAEDYFIYRFYEKNWRTRKQFVTAWKSLFLIRHFNHAAPEERRMVEDKTIFAVEFRDYVRREILSSDGLEWDTFREFLRRLGRVIIKPAEGFNGNGVYILRDTDDATLIQNAYGSFRTGRYVIEEVLEQDGFLREMNPATLNTIRVNVVRKDGSYRIQNAILRSGQGDVVTDNICAGGVVCEIDVESGLIMTPYCDLTGRRVLKHPLTGVVVLGRVIPAWESVKEAALSAAKKISGVRYTSWDVAVIKGSNVAIVEGNTYGNFNIQQVPRQEGILKQYQELR